MTVEETVARNLATTIRDNKHFKKFLLALKAADRRIVYDSLVPFLKFKPKPFWVINL